MFEQSMADLLINPSPQDEDTNASLLPAKPLQWSGLSLAEALLPLVESSSPPVPQGPWLCSTRYKTELCSRYAESGSCKYGERCQFAHGLHDLRMPSRHPKYKTELCRAFHVVGHCAYGARCLFVHGAEEQRQAKPRRRRNIPCRTFSSFGVCPFGARCNFLHVGTEKMAKGSRGVHLQANEWHRSGTVCRTFNSFGFCLYGTRCRFQHSLSSCAGGLSGSCVPQESGTRRALSPAWDMLSSTASSISSPSALASPVDLEDLASPFALPETPAKPLSYNSFTFSNQHLSDLLLPLAWKLQKLERTRARAISLVDAEDKGVSSS